ncbi:MAG: glycoside hydrolase family 15 protein [Deltaproteobacteria bacterium]|nr:glycoside hydrolase family 15 protein [Deltaproteobacteria bacterium]
MTSPYLPIENYGIIGNLRTAALVGMNGSIDFMCFPHFDSPSVFCALLDHKKGGRFKIAPVHKGVKHKQLYLPNTNILFTRFLSDTGVAEVCDFMPIAHHAHADALVREVKCIRGEIKFLLECSPKFNYGLSELKVRTRENEVYFMSTGHDKVAFRLHSPEKCEIKDGAAYAEFTLRAGERRTFVFEELHDTKISRHHSEFRTHAAFHETVVFWENWITRSTYRGRWREMVDRSALTLKLLTSAEYGSMVASPTFGLPERLGGGRNWDYRYTWIRDGSFTLYSLIKLGFTDEAQAFMHWLEGRCGKSHANGPIQVMYRLDGSSDLPESKLKHFEGYMKSSPVRIGNHAADQLQLDIYGELMDSVYLYNRFGNPISNRLWKDLVPIVDWVSKNWNQADEGIWEVRSGRKEFLYSRIMCWVALDRAIRIAKERSFPGPIDEWCHMRNKIYNDVFDNFWCQKKHSFVQFKNSKTLDASSLVAPMVHFISPTDPQWQATLHAIEKELVSDSLVYRYRPDEHFEDGIPEDEGTFCMCSFWYVEVLARSGQVDKARFYFEKMLSYGNHLGLYSEELGPSGEHLGNMPQAFTHLALISAALHLNELLDNRDRFRK